MKIYEFNCTIVKSFDTNFDFNGYYKYILRTMFP